MYGYCKVIISSLSQKSRVPYGGNPSAAWEQATNAKFSINAVSYNMEQDESFILF
jgi:hypothetical protein